jgi:mycobactin lysine-N-oxygenase
MEKRIAVVGGGPKAAAICAKVDCLRQTGVRIEVTIFEKRAWGAAWSGAHGYTDGRQRLCTPAERDVGFPYQVGLLRKAEDVANLHTRYSWAAYLVSKAATGQSYLDWVNRGRRPPTHAEYSGYISWVIERAHVERKLLEVTAIERSRRKWVLKARNPTTTSPESFDFDGVVVTGPGPPQRLFDRPVAEPRVTDGAAFWSNPAGFLSQCGGNRDPIVLVGSGGTSAAIAAWIARMSHQRRPIIIIGNQAALFTRSESFF